MSENAKVRPRVSRGRCQRGATETAGQYWAPQEKRQRTAALQNLAELDAAAISRSVLECGCPLPLSRAIALADRHFQSHRLSHCLIATNLLSFIVFPFVTRLTHVTPRRIVSWTEAIFLALATAAGGGINAVAGGGTLITFPALLLFGTP